MATIKKRFIGVGAALLAALSWGSSTVMSKGALEDFSPVLLLNIQIVSSLVFLWALIFIFGIKRNFGRGIWKVSVLGILEPGVAYFLGLIGLAWVSAGTASLIQATEALMIALLCALFFKERLSTQFFALSCVSLVGLAIVLGGAVSVSGLEILGQLLIFGGTLAAAIYVVLSSKVSTSMSPIVMVAYQQISALGLSLIALSLSWGAGGVSLPDVDVSGWILAVISGIIQYAVAFALYFYATRFITASSAGAFLCMVPVFGILGGVIFLAEVISLVQLLGAALTVASITIMSIYYMPDVEDSLAEKSHSDKAQLEEA